MPLGGIPTGEERPPASSPAPAIGDGGAPPYAIVSVYTPLQRKVSAPEDVSPETEGEEPFTRVFHYAVPEAMRAEIRVGQLVWVPFHGRHLQGVVVGFDISSPVEKTLDIEEIVDPEPILSPVHLELARWISEYYLAPMHLVTLGMLPPGITQRVEAIISAVPDVEPATVTKAQGELLALLRQKGPLTLRQVVRLSKRKDARAVVNQLISHGWATRRVEVLPPRVKPQLVFVVRARLDLRPGLSFSRAGAEAGTGVPGRATRGFRGVASAHGGGGRPLGDVARSGREGPR